MRKLLSTIKKREFLELKSVKFLYLRLRPRNMNSSDDFKPVRSYNRTWEEIEVMLDKAVARRNKWKQWFDQCRDDGDRDGMKEAARNHKALDGVIKTLQWTLGQEGIDHPLD